MNNSGDFFQFKFIKGIDILFDSVGILWLKRNDLVVSNAINFRRVDALYLRGQYCLNCIAL